MFPVVGAISMATGALAALEAIKIISGTGRPMFGELRLLDAFGGNWSTIELLRDAQCPVCANFHPRTGP
jgi:adenylyltransferase/sulfurtransferase